MRDYFYKWKRRMLLSYSHFIVRVLQPHVTWAGEGTEGLSLSLFQGGNSLERAAKRPVWDTQGWTKGLMSD